MEMAEIQNYLHQRILLKFTDVALFIDFLANKSSLNIRSNLSSWPPNKNIR